MIGWNLFDVLKAKLEDIEASAVDCGNCPVNIACAAERGGTGIRYDCCGATGVDIGNDPSVNLLIVDCMRNRFEDVHRPLSNTCPLCTGKVIDAAVRTFHDHTRYLRTIHGAVPMQTRLDVWKRTLPIATRLFAQDNARSKA